MKRQDWASPEEALVQGLPWVKAAPKLHEQNAGSIPALSRPIVLVQNQDHVPGGPD